MGVRLPTVSVIVPTRNRLESLRACLRALDQLDYPSERVEAVVVDDGSVPPVSASLHSSGSGPNLRLLRGEGKGPAVARNRGVAVAEGDLLAFTDDDCIPSPTWLRELVAAHESRPDAAVGGQVVNGLDENPFADASQMLVTYLYHYYNDGNSGARFFTSNNLLAPAREFRAAGGFDSTFPLAAAEDRDFCDRWYGGGRPLVYNSRAVVYHRHRMGLRTYLAQHYNYGRGAYHFHLRRRTRGHGRLRLEPPVFYANLLAWPLRERKRKWNWRLRLAALLLVSQGANACGFFREALHPCSPLDPSED